MWGPLIQQKYDNFSSLAQCCLLKSRKITHVATDLKKYGEGNFYKVDNK